MTTAAAEVPALMKAIAARDEEALRELYGRFSKALYHAILAIVKRKEDAEEILCDVFHQVWEKASAYEAQKGSVYTWMLTLSRNRAIDRLRSKGYKAALAERQSAADSGGPEAAEGLDALDLLASASAESPLDRTLLSERAALVQAALRKISPEQRQVLEVAYFEGYTQTEIAEKLGLPLGTVKSRARDGMKLLHHLLKDAI